MRCTNDAAAWRTTQESSRAYLETLAAIGSVSFVLLILKRKLT